LTKRQQNDKIRENEKGVTTMYIKDKNQRITLRLSDEQFAFVKDNADILGVSPSEFLRMVVNASMVGVKSGKIKDMGVLGRANDKSNSVD
jgi:predicted DNA binding CopG/RHH family protein